MRLLTLDDMMKAMKALSDETRLRIVGTLGDTEYNVGTLADMMALSNATMSHHLKRLHAVGLVNIRTEGNQHFYKANLATLRHISESLANLDEISRRSIPVVDDKSWIEALPLSEEDRAILPNYIEAGRLKRIPMQQKKLLAVIHWLLLDFEEGRIYSEREVNEIILRYNEDYAGLRRDMIGFGYLRRERGGSSYWLTPKDEVIGEL